MSKKNKIQGTVDKAPEVKVKNKKANSSLAQSGSNTGLQSMTNWMVALVVILPIIFSRLTMDPAIAVRYIFLSSFILLFVLYFYLLQKRSLGFYEVESGSFFRLSKIVFYLGIGFCVWNIVAMSASINMASSYYEVGRQLLNILLLWIIMQVVKVEESQAVKLFKALVLVSIIQSFVGIMQYFDVVFTELPGANEKPYGLMANRNLFGSAQAFLLPFVLFVLYAGSKRWKFVSIIAFIGIIISLLLSQTRSAWLAGIAVIIVSLILVLIYIPTLRKKWIIATLSGAALIAVITLLLLVTDKEGSFAESVKQRAYTLATFSKSNAASVENVNERIKFWKKTIEMIKAHPILGAGPGNWKVAVSSYGSEGLVWAKGIYSPDRPHNVYLQVASETGIPGAVLYFGMWILIGIIGFKIIIKQQVEERRILAILMVAGLVAFATDSFFSFPTERIEHSLYIILMGGIILGCYSNCFGKEKPIIASIERRGPLNINILTLFLLLPAYNIFIGLKKYNFEMHMNSAKDYEDQKRYNDVLVDVEEGKSFFVTIDPNGVPLEVRSSLAYKELGDYDKAMIEIVKAKRLNPYCAMIYNNMGNIYTYKKENQKAIESYNYALKLTPEFDVVFKNLAINYYAIGNDSACIRVLGKVKIEGDEYLTNLLSSAKNRMALQK